MTTPAKQAANRRNAKRSTGPRTGAGKARASRNALRHGLSTDITRDPTWAARVEPLARALLGPGEHGPDALHLARLAAAAQVEIWRIRAHRTAVTGRALAPLQEKGFDEAAAHPSASILSKGAHDCEYMLHVWSFIRSEEADLLRLSHLNGVEGCKRLMASAERNVAALRRNVEKHESSRDAARPSLADAEGALADLVRLDRYERRAASRRRALLRNIHARTSPPATDDPPRGPPACPSGQGRPRTRPPARPVRPAAVRLTAADVTIAGFARQIFGAAPDAIPREDLAQLEALYDRMSEVLGFPPRRTAGPQCTPRPAPRPAPQPPHD
ncbi:hypothetical protein [Salinarimonas soli]|uniref:Uncharacterized protein n=1 Tax=Salinarimonas soli TaxID=1638099 RepID=A0A5B2V7L7_9HYPH|nr:hypothetical protein [Salinarimonas soli]KAA2234806.1 hypothetical protein F0L46_22930 [Salinarimonas soli]